MVTWWKHGYHESVTSIVEEKFLVYSVEVQRNYYRRRSLKFHVTTIYIVAVSAYKNKMK